MKNCTRVLRAGLCLLLVIIAGLKPGYGQQIAKGINVSNGDYLGFLEYKPADYNTDVKKRYPLIIFLHGVGEKGNGTTDLNKLTCCGIPKVIRLGNKMSFTWNGKTETFIVLSPQCPAKYGMWPDILLAELLQYAKTNLRIDPNRIYLTGLSMGGGGSFKFLSAAAENPKQFAAAAPICPPCTFSNGKYVADANLPFWGFHAMDDNIVSYNCTEQAISKINSYNPEVKPLKTIWPTGGHIVWDRVYTDTLYTQNHFLNIYEWFLGQNKSLAVNKLPVAKAGGVVYASPATGIATLNASTSTDEDGKIVRYVWKKKSGPATGVITTKMGPNPTTTVTGLTEGTYLFELVVVDDRAGFSSDVVTVNVIKGHEAPNLNPIAHAGGDIFVTLPVDKTTLIGSQSTDRDGSIAIWQWTKISGPAQFTIANSGVANTPINNLVQGVYVFKLKVTDNKGAISEDEVTVTVNPATLPTNKIPVANAGSNSIITLPVNKTTLDGRGSTDPDGTIKTWLWTKVSGPNSFNIVSPGSSATQVNNLTEGTYVFKLKVTDDRGGFAEAMVIVKVSAAPNSAPVAKAGSDITITLPANKATLNGGQSTDSDGSITGWLWVKVSGPSQFNIASAASASTEVTNLSEGTYVFKLKITDNRGATSEDEVTVKVNKAPNVLPVAKAGNDITITLPSNKVALNGNQSTDSDGSITGWLWTKVSGPSPFNIVNKSSASTEVSNLVEGTYVFRLKITDNRGGNSEDDITVKVNPAPKPNVLPEAKAGNDISITLPVNKVRLNGSGSNDDDGSIVSYSWAKITGPSQFIITTPGAVETEVKNLKEGTYTFRLRVTDNRGGIGDDLITLTVNAAPPPPNVAPTAQAGPDKTITLPSNSVSVNGQSSTDADGEIKSYRWTFVSGPSSYTITDADAAKTNITGLEQGVYAFRLEVKDNDGASDADTVKIKVNAEASPEPVPNVIPAAKISAQEIVITLPVNETTLDGSTSSDEDGTIASYVWTKASGPASFNIVNRNSSSTLVENLEEGVYVFRLTVKDNDGALASATVKVVVKPATNMAPVADAGVDIEITLPDPGIRLNGLNSYDPDGTIDQYSWMQIDGAGGLTITNSTTTTPGVLGAKEGTYVFRLTVRDNNGAESSDDVTLTILAAKADDTTVTTPPTDSIPDDNLRYEEVVKLFPNPAKSELNVRLTDDSKGQLGVAIYDIRGMLVYSYSGEKTSAQYQQRVNVGNLEPGMYILRTTVGNRKTTTKFLKR